MIAAPYLLDLIARRSPVVFETALAVILLIGAGLLVRSFARLLLVDPGFRPASLLTFHVPISSARYGKDSLRVAFYEDLLDRLHALPGVRSAAAADFLPIGGGGPNIEFAVEGRPSVPVGAFVGKRIVTPDYFHTMGIPLLHGRPLNLRDRAGLAAHAPVQVSFGAGDQTLKVHGEILRRVAIF